MTLKIISYWILQFSILFLVGCVQNAPPPIDEVSLPAPVGNVDLIFAHQTPPENQLLDIAVNVFEVALSEEETLEFGEWIFSEIRANETHYLPYTLRETLLRSNQWGAVRVLPDSDPSVDLQIKAKVMTSSGKRILVHVVAADSSGRVWLDQEYLDLASENDFPGRTRYTAGQPFKPDEFVEPFQDIYNKINNSLVEFRATLTEQELVDLKRVSEMVYASDLAPESFDRNLEKTENNLLTVVSLPAKDDPMLRRVKEMRARHHLFIDTVDEYYGSLYENMRPSYAVWRKYSFDQINENLKAAGEQYDFENFGRSGRYLTLTQRYDRYRWSKIFELEYREISAGFNNEVGPAILELNERVHGLSGTMEEQYIQWTRILRQLFSLEAQIPE